MTVHDFNECLAKSHDADDLPLWKECYEKAFHPHFSAMVCHRQDGDHQRQGIDRTVILNNGKSLWIDEKVRFKDYGRDVAIEYVSNTTTGAPGWACKELLCDYIAYAVAPAGWCVLLPVVQLQQAWQKNGQDWINNRNFKNCVAPNNGYSTLSVAVPVPVLFKEIGAALRVTFTPVDGGLG